MQGSGRTRIRICHAAAFSALAFVLGAMLIARGNWADLRANFAQSFRLYASLKSAIAEDAVQHAVASIGELPGVAAAHPRDRDKDQAALFAQEPWAKEYEAAMRTHFLPAIVEIKLRNPFASPDDLAALAEKIRAIDSVDQVMLPAESHSHLAQVVRVGDAALLAALLAAVVLVFLACAPLEYLRVRAEDSVVVVSSQHERHGRWLADRLVLAIAGCVAGAALAALVAAWVAQAHSHVHAVFFKTGDVVLLLAVALISPLTWASVIHALHQPRRFSQTVANEAEGPNEAAAVPAGSPTQARTAYERNDPEGGE